MKTSFLLSFLLLAVSAVTVKAGCGRFKIALEGDNCGSDVALEKHGKKALYNAMIWGIEHETGMSKQDVISMGNFITSHDGQISSGYEDESRRFLRESEPSHRELQTCDGTSEGCIYTWCCMVCNWNCWRREMLEEAAHTSGRSLDAVTDAVCGHIANLLSDAHHNGHAGCMKGAHLEMCEWGT